MFFQFFLCSHVCEYISQEKNASNIFSDLNERLLNSKKYHIINKNNHKKIFCENNDLIFTAKMIDKSPNTITFEIQIKNYNSKKGGTVIVGKNECLILIRDYYVEMPNKEKILGKKRIKIRNIDCVQNNSSYIKCKKRFRRLFNIIHKTKIKNSHNYNIKFNFFDFYIILAGNEYLIF